MVEVNLMIWSLSTVLSAYGSFRLTYDIGIWLSEKKWYMPVLVVVLMFVGFFVIRGVY